MGAGSSLDEKAVQGLEQAQQATSDRLKDQIENGPSPTAAQKRQDSFDLFQLDKAQQDKHRLSRTLEAKLAEPTHFSPLQNNVTAPGLPYTQNTPFDYTARGMSVARNPEHQHPDHVYTQTGVRPPMPAGRAPTSAFTDDNMGPGWRARMGGTQWLPGNTVYRNQAVEGVHGVSSDPADVRGVSNWKAFGDANAFRGGNVAWGVMDSYLTSKQEKEKEDYKKWQKEGSLSVQFHKDREAEAQEYASQGPMVAVRKSMTATDKNVAPTSGEITNDALTRMSINAMNRNTRHY